MGKRRDLFKEIKEMTGSRSSSYSAVKHSTGRVVSEEKYIKKRWKQYTENQYGRDPKINDIFNENLYEDDIRNILLDIKVKKQSDIYLTEKL